MGRVHGVAGFAAAFTALGGMVILYGVDGLADEKWLLLDCWQGGDLGVLVANLLMSYM